MLSPSAIQRAEDFVGMAMPTVPLSSACGEAANAERAIATAAASVLIPMRNLPETMSAAAQPPSRAAAAAALGTTPAPLQPS